MNTEGMVDRIETERLVLFPYTQENLALFNTDLSAFEERFGVLYRGEELDHLLRGFLLKLEREIAADPEHYLFFTEFLIVQKESDRIIGSIDYKYVPRDGLTEVGYGLNPLYEGRGFMTEALRAFLDFGKSHPNGPGGHAAGQHRLAARTGKVRLPLSVPKRESLVGKDLVKKCLYTKKTDRKRSVFLHLIAYCFFFARRISHACSSSMMPKSAAMMPMPMKVQEMLRATKPSSSSIGAPSTIAHRF